MSGSKKSSIRERVMKIAEKVGTEVHLKAIRDGFLTTIPFLVLSGFMVFFAYVLFSGDNFITQNLPKNVVDAIVSISSKTMNGGQNILSLFMVLLVSYNLAKYKNYKSPLMPALVSLGTLFILMPSEISYGTMGTSGMLVCLMTALIVTDSFLFLNKQQWLKIKISGNVPPAIIESFNSMFIVILIEIVASIVSFACLSSTGLEIHALINDVIQRPLVGVATNLPVFLLYFGFGQCLLYFFGIHPAGVINPIFEPLLLVAIEDNNKAWLAGNPIPNIINLPFRDVYGTLGGIACTLGLIIAIFLVSKRKDIRDVAKVGLPTSVFNINEPILFGIPIVFNPILFIPFCFTTTIIYIIAYFATYIGLVSKLVVYTTWSTPIFLSGYIASGGDFRNVILQAVCLVIAVLCYLPFVKLLDRQKVTEIGDADDSDLSLD